MQFRFSLAILLASAALVRGAEMVETYPDGAKKAVYATNTDGQKQGAYEEYYPNGKTKLRANYRADKLTGPYRSYHEGGKAHINTSYKDGVLHGAYSERQENGTLRIKTTYRDGQLNGAYQEFTDGKLARDELWIAGQLVLPKSRNQITATLAQIEKAPVETVGQLPETTDAVKGYVADAAAQRERENAVRILMAYRYVCDVPFGDLALDLNYIAHCEAGCELLTKINEMTHTPRNPGLPEAEYQFAYQGCNKSNLYSAPSATRSIHAFMDDSDEGNIDRLGHRRWCLNPRMQKTGLAGRGGYSAMWSMDRSRQETPDYEMVTFPPRGLCPAAFFKESYAWSVSVNPQKYNVPEEAEVKVTVTPARLNPQRATLELAPAPLSIEYFHIDRGGFGINNCIIFRPAGVRVQSGACYRVQIAGVKDSQGNAAPIEYLAVFF